MQHWLNQHTQAIQLVWQRLSAQWVSTLLILMVIGVTLAVPSLIYVVTNNAQQLIGDLKKEAQISLFLKQDITQSNIDEVDNALKNNAEVNHYVFVSKEDALKKLIETSNNAEAISALQDNPLPHAFFIEPNATITNENHPLLLQLQNLSGVEEVVLDSGWMRKLSNLLTIGQQAVWIFGLLLSFAIIAVISNTIRMQIVTHKEEIEVSELFGATKSFIRRPFLYLGSAYGLGGGIFATIILMLIVYLFNQSVQKIAKAYQADFLLHFNPIPTFVTITLISSLIGWLAAYFAVTMHHNK